MIKSLGDIMYLWVQEIDLNGQNGQNELNNTYLMMIYRTAKQNREKTNNTKDQTRLSRSTGLKY